MRTGAFLFAIEIRSVFFRIEQDKQPDHAHITEQQRRHERRTAQKALADKRAFGYQVGLDVVHLLLLLAFFVMTTIIAARQVLFTGEITLNKIVGAICIFFLLGLIWATMYLLLLEWDPATFNNIQHVSWHDSFPKVVYFSFVTMTTLGYGDISPALPLARFLAYLEAVMGLFYIAVMVASLVGVRVASHPLSHKKE